MAKTLLLHSLNFADDKNFAVVDWEPVNFLLGY